MDTPARWRLSRLLVLLCIVAMLAVPGIFAWQQWLEDQRTSALARARAGKFADAEPQLLRHAARDPQDVDVLKALAQGYLAAQKKLPAEDYLTRWLAARPDDAAALRLRLQLYRDQRRLELALADTQRLLELEPNNLDLLRQLAGRYFETGRFAEAEQTCLRSLKHDCKDPGMRALLAQAYRAQGETTRASEVLDELLGEDPRNPKALLGRAILYCDANQADRAIPLLQQFLEVDPRQERTALYHLSIALTRVGRLEEAEKMRARVRQLQDAGVLLGDSKTVLNNLELQLRTARALFVSGEDRKAVDVLAGVLRQDPGHASAHRLLADYYERCGESQRAAEHRRQAGAE
jgi:predicted Zn-dependent protease